MRKLWRKVRRSATAYEPTASCWDVRCKSQSYSLPSVESSELRNERRRSKSESYLPSENSAADCVDGRVYVIERCVLARVCARSDVAFVAV